MVEFKTIADEQLILFAVDGILINALDLISKYEKNEKREDDPIVPIDVLVDVLKDYKHNVLEIKKYLDKKYPNFGNEKKFVQNFDTPQEMLFILEYFNKIDNLINVVKKYEQIENDNKKVERKATVKKTSKSKESKRKVQPARRKIRRVIKGAKDEEQ